MDVLLLVLVSSVLAVVRGCELIVCEDGTETVDCPAGQMIDIQEAFYGREDNITCSKDKPNQELTDTDCSSPVALDKYINLCTNKTMCTVEAGNSVTGDDPCGGTYKYARIRYTCITANPAGFELATDYFRSSTELNWSEANDYCIDNNGSLILLNNDEDWDNFISEASRLFNMCRDFHWTALQCDPSSDCNSGGTCSHNGWGNWLGTEHYECQQHPCVVANWKGMRTSSCCDKYPALCRKDVSTTTPNTNSSPVPAYICTTTNTQSTAAVTSYDRTTTQSTLTGTLTAVLTDDGTTPYNNTPVVDGSCEECCHRQNKSRQLSHEELRSIIRDLKFQLAVNKKTLSAYRRKLGSAYDSRPSSVAMGGVAVAILVAFVAIIVVPDMVKLTRFLSKRQKKYMP